MLIIKKIEFTIIILMLSVGIAYPNNYFCDPVNGDINNSGSVESPWSSLSDVFNAGTTFNSGDTLFVYSGEHGNVNITQHNDDYVVISAIAGGTPKLSGLILNESSYWKFIGVDISRTAPQENYNVYSVSDEYFLVQTDKNSNNISFKSCNIYTEGVDVVNWNRNDWFIGTLSGMMIRSKYTQVENCLIKNTNFSIEVRGRYTEVRNTIIENFVGDAIRALSSFSIYEYNTVKNSYDITGYDDNSSGQNPDYPIGGGNHDDLFQSYTSSVGGSEYTVSDVVVRYNKFYSYTDSNQTDKSYTQGVALFDGFFNNWLIENNLIVTDSWHGITMLGVNDAVIANNTLLANPIPNDLILGNGGVVDDMTPFIWIGKTKSGEKSYDNTVRNNLIIESNFGASSYKNIIDEAENSRIQNNFTVPTSDEDKYFIDYPNFDLNSKINSPSIDQGINIDLPVYDLNNTGRLIGKQVDCGAYEFDNSAEGNNCPVIQPIENQNIEQYKTLELIIEAVDIDESSIILEAFELEDFMTFVDNGDGTALLTVSPLDDHVGEYQITVSASDDTGNENIRSFMIQVDYGTIRVKSYKEMQINVFPNPIVKGNSFQIVVENQDFSISENIDVYDMKGVKVLSLKPTLQSKSLIVQTNDFNESGMYIISYKGLRKIISIQ